MLELNQAIELKRKLSTNTCEIDMFYYKFQQKCDVETDLFKFFLMIMNK